jgi:hypothetical protein
LVFVVALLAALSCPVLANAPPVRIAVVPGGGSGVEQDIVDLISQQLGGVDGVALSTVNPDWYAVCNIRENIDQMSGQIRYNGNVLVKTVSGKVLTTVAVQKYNQDFSTSPGAPLNKALVDRAAREVIGNLANRAVQGIQQAVMIEMEGRSRVNEANELAAQGKYDDAMTTLEQITPDFVEFAAVRSLHEKILRQKQGKAAHGGTKSTHLSHGSSASHAAGSSSASKTSSPFNVSGAPTASTSVSSSSSSTSGSKNAGAGIDKHAILNEFSGAPH